MVHLSARVSWHDSGWNGRICQAPHQNASCIVQEVIRDERDDEKEKQFAGVPLGELQGWLPPCSRDTNTYSPYPIRFLHHDPLARTFLKPVPDEIPPYSVLPAPYRWLSEEHLREVCEAEQITVRGPNNPDKTGGWISEPDRQRQLLDYFWGKVKDGEGKSLVFYYVNHGNPVDENASRLLVGVGRLAKVGPQLYFDGTDPRDPNGEHFPIWTRTITQDYPAQGFRLPYQEYIREGHDPRSIACYVPRDMMMKFSYVGEHVTDDLAVGILERLLQSVETIQRDGIAQGNWERHLVWLNSCLDEVWTGRGPYPGIGSVLHSLHFPHGAAFQRLVLKDFVKNNQNPLDYVLGILEGRVNPPEQYAQAFQKAQLVWRGFSRNPVRQTLLKLLTRFELSTEQVKRISDPDLRQQSGINVKEEDLVANPYLISELDLGTAESEVISLDVIDRGMVPEGNAALFIKQDDIYPAEDTRRVRATAVSALKEAAELGDTIFTIPDLLDKIRARFPEKRACRPDRDLFYAELEYYEERLWMATENEPHLVALKHLRELEQAIAKTVERRVKRVNAAPNPPIDWRTAMIAQFGEPKTAREAAALDEKAQALEILFSKRISILTGSAGTGKTSTLKFFLNELEKAEGKQGLYLLAPTGKARVRLSTSTKRNAMTIHQFLLKNQWFMPDIFVLKREGGGQTFAPTVIIDECSMVPVDLLGTLFKALNLDMIKRLVLVGDPNQLPPIGPGRPFVDLVEWMKEKNPDCIATLRTTMRTSEDDPVTNGKSVALWLADGYRSETPSPGDDEILSLVAQGSVSGDLEVHFWNDHDELKRILRERMEKLLDIKDGDYKGFAKSFGITDKPYAQPNWKDAERWQILSPVHAHAFGTEEINRNIQQTYKRGLIKTAQAHYSKTPRPFGDQQIVYTDKVIQVLNKRMWAFPRDKEPLDYVANGEIGIVTSTGKGDKGEYLQVGFSTQDAVTYRYLRGMVNENLELAYALTVHKSQGSDFDYVFLIIPHEAPTLSRELIYTGLTRFRKKLILLVEKDINTLRELRQAERSDTHQRNTFLFDISLRPEQPGRFYPEALIHRTSTGVAVRSKSEVIVADTLTRLGLRYLYEEPLAVPNSPKNFRLPDFTIGYEGDIYYWEHLGMLRLPGYREDWERKRRWYEETIGIPVVGDGADKNKDLQPGVSPIVITSRDQDDGGIDVQSIEKLVRKYILLEG